MARYIDADKAVEDARLSYCKDCNSYNGIRCRSCGFDDAMDYIEDAPSADVAEVKHGEWVVEDYNDFIIPLGSKIICSCCGYRENRGSAWDIKWGMYKYCPNCGAKMDG